jgi:serine/threonine protein kinase
VTCGRHRHRTAHRPRGQGLARPQQDARRWLLQSTRRPLRDGNHDDGLPADAIARPRHRGAIVTIEIPGYRIERELGRGGMAVVYLAEQVSLQRRVALKVMSEDIGGDATFTERFLREARIAARLAHPNIITVHEVGRHADWNFIAMEFHDGGDLKGRLRRGLDRRTALSITRDLARALGFAHEAGYIHRDIKPANVIFRRDGSPVLMDFGIAKATAGDTRLTQAGAILGTPYYMSPEQVNGEEPDARSDLYSLGVMLYEMLTGQIPYTGETAMSIMFAHVARPVPVLPPGLADYQPLVGRMLAKKRPERVQAAAEVVAELERLLQALPHDVPAPDAVRAAPLPAVADSTRGLTLSPGETGAAPVAAATVEVPRPPAGGDAGTGLTLTFADSAPAADPGTGLTLTFADNAPASAATVPAGAGTSPLAETSARAPAPATAAPAPPAAVPPLPAVAPTPPATVAAASPSPTASTSARTASEDAATQMMTDGTKPALAGTAPASSAATAGAASTTAGATTAARRKRPDVGSVIRGRFELVAKLGQGGMGTVFKGVDLLKREAGEAEPYVAVKLLSSALGRSANALRLIQRETSRSQALSHPNIITVYDFDRDDDQLFMTMELLDGDPLDEAIAHGHLQRATPEERARIIEQMAAGLAYAHQNLVVHSDFKPGNVFLCADGRVKVLDFGIARVIDGGGGDTLHAYTPRYATAELMQRQDAHPADDVYALACVAYEVMTGNHPFDGKTIIQAQASGMKPARIAGASRHQWAAIERGLAFERADRIQDAAAFLATFKPGLNWKLIGAVAAATAVGIAGLAAWLGVLATDPEADIPEAERAAAVAHVATAQQYLAQAASSPRLWLTRYPAAIDEFARALRANPFNADALAALESEARAVLALPANTVIEKQNLDARIGTLLRVENVPLRDELLARQAATR